MALDLMGGVAPKVSIRWFHERPALAACLAFTEYKQCAAAGPRLGYVRQSFHTLLVDLTAPPEEILAGFQPRTRSVVRQAARLGVVAEIEEDQARFLEIYDTFARNRGLAPLDRHHAFIRPGPTLITKASLGGRLLVTRGYLLDRQAGRARNLASATADHAADDQETARLVGIAHRYLVHADMLRFRADGFRDYDFGGYAVGTTDPKLANINRFKDSFGGRIVAEPTYRSWPLHLALRARRWAAALRAGPGRSAWLPGEAP